MADATGLAEKMLRLDGFRVLEVLEAKAEPRLQPHQTALHDRYRSLLAPTKSPMLQRVTADAAWSGCPSKRAHSCWSARNC